MLELSGITESHGDDLEFTLPELFFGVEIHINMMRMGSNRLTTHALPRYISEHTQRLFDQVRDIKRDS